jgi:putative transposase
MDKSSDIRTGRHCVFNLHVHLVFVTKYRRNVLTAPMLKALKGFFEKVCQDFDSKLVECQGEDDHVHLLVDYPPLVHIPSLVNSLKGVSSRRLKQLFPLLVKKCVKGALWSPSYFAASCGGAPIHVIRKYIENQRMPQA